MRILLAAAFLVLVASAAGAATIEVKGAWIRATPPGATTAAGYASLTNHGLSTDRLMGAHTAVAANVAPHQMSMAGGVMRMRPITGGLPIAASATVSLSPNGNHLMLTGLKRPLKVGSHVRIVLQFQRAGDVAADFVVRADAPGGMAGMHM
jgi:copper(I)-binding protein